MRWVLFVLVFLKTGNHRRLDEGIVIAKDG